jgi:ABC-2 type transport system ATP-binding protein
MSIEVKELTKVYGDQKAIDHISFTINKGEIVGFLGPNGAGKSTTMKIITGYLSQENGDAFVCGTNVKEQPMETKRKIGYLPEANPLYSDMYVKEYLGFVADVHAVKSNRSAAINRAIQLVGLTTESRKKISQLSKGYKQRVGLDRVIIINKGKIVADDTLKHLQNAKKNNHTIFVKFKESVDAVLIENLQEISSAQQMQTGDWKLETDNPESVRKQLMQLSLQHNLNIVSLQSGEQSLEEVFRSLTS